MHEDHEDRAHHTWRDRHGATVLGVILAGVFALVLTIQAAC